MTELDLFGPDDLDGIETSGPRGPGRPKKEGKIGQDGIGITGGSRRAKTVKAIIREGKRADRVEEVIGDIVKGSTMHLVSMGEWSVHDVIRHLVAQTGPVDLYLCTWSVGEDGFRTLMNLRESGQIRRIIAVYDYRVKAWNPKVYQLVKTQADRVAVTACHAKAFVLINDDFALTYTGSANLTNNPRIEVQVLTEDRTVAEFHRDWILDLVHHQDRFAPRDGRPDLPEVDTLNTGGDAAA